MEVELGHRQGWRELLTFTLRATRITTPGQYRAYNNSPRDMTDEDHAKATAALQSVIARIEQERAQNRADPPEA